MALLNIFGKKITTPTPVGTQAKTPTVTPPSNTLPANQKATNPLGTLQSLVQSKSAPTQSTQNVFNTTTPYSSTTNKTGVPAQNVVSYNNANNTGSTRVIESPGYSAPVNTKGTQTGILGAINNFGKNLATTPFFQGFNAIYGTNYGNTNPSGATGDFLTANQNNPPKLAPNAQNGGATASSVGSSSTSAGAGNTGDNTQEQIKALQDMIASGQGLVQNAKNAGYTSGQQIQTDANGNIIPATTGQNNVGVNNTGTGNNLTQASMINQFQDIQNKLAESRANMAKDIYGVQTSGVDVGLGTGRERALQGLYQGQQSALAGQAQGLGTMAGMLAPVGQFGMLTNPLTGEPLNTSMFQSAIQQARQLAENTGNPQDPSVLALLAPFGFVGNMAFNNAMMASQGTGYNPMAMSASALQNTALGTQTQGQAFLLDTGIKQLNTLTPIIEGFMQQSNINPTSSPLYNAQIGTYLSKVANAGQYNQFEMMMGEMRKFQSQLLASGAGGIPTDVSNTINATDISQLSLKDIRTALQTLDILGKNQQAVLQEQQRATGNVGYSGSQQNIQTSVPVATSGTGFGTNITSPGGQFLAGSGLSVAGSPATWISAGLALLKSIKF